MPLKGKSKTARKRPAASDDGAKSEKAQGDGTSSAKKRRNTSPARKVDAPSSRATRTTRSHATVSAAASPNSSVEGESDTKMKQATRRTPRTTITKLAATNQKAPSSKTSVRTKRAATKKAAAKSVTKDAKTPKPIEKKKTTLKTNQLKKTAPKNAVKKNKTPKKAVGKKSGSKAGKAVAANKTVTTKKQEGQSAAVNKSTISPQRQERQIKNSLKDIAEKNGILRGVKSLGEQVIQMGSRCYNFRLGSMYWSWNNPFCNYLQDQTNITLNLNDEDVRCKELGDVIFYYLTRDEEPDEHVQSIIYSLLNGYSWKEVFWHVLCCHVLQEVKTFEQLYKRLGNNLTAIQYLLYKQPMLLLNHQAGWLMERLIDHLPYKKLHQIITDIRDRNGQTHMFYASFDESQTMHAEGYLDQFTELYSQKFVDLYGLLSIRNIDGQTALHVNTRHITKLMADTYTLAQGSLFINLISITDNNNQTAVQVSNDDRLSSLIFQVENN